MRTLAKAQLSIFRSLFIGTRWYLFCCLQVRFRPRIVYWSIRVWGFKLLRNWWVKGDASFFDNFLMYFEKWPLFMTTMVFDKFRWLSKFSIVFDTFWWILTTFGLVVKFWKNELKFWFLMHNLPRNKSKS